MAHAEASTNETAATYEIRLLGPLAPALLQRFPALSVCTERPETLLFRQIEEPGELDALLERLLSMGMVLTEVHELPVLRDASASERHGALIDDNGGTS